MKNDQWVVGIDYSMSCPAITVVATKDFSFENCRAHYLSEKPAKALLPNVHASRLGQYKHDQQRFDMISDWAMSCVEDLDPETTSVFMEDYSFGSKGKVFHIAENSGLVKHKLYRRGFSLVSVPPTVIKQFATGKGNSDKDRMYEAFINRTGVNLMELYQPKAKKVGSPVGDLVDSFFICQYGFEFIRQTRD
jgi:Holliday junction resolvasome RuvABC endonuclease subunit